MVNHMEEIVDINISSHEKWNINKWKEILKEKLGILAFEAGDVELCEMTGICIFHDRIPIILLNDKDSPINRIFSLFHELTHLLLGKSAICNGSQLNKKEIFCNAVSEKFLAHILN